MPLMPGKSKKAFSKNVEIEMHAGKPQKQSLAIAYSVKNKKPKKKASGGSVQSGSKDMNYAEGGAVGRGSMRTYQEQSKREKGVHTARNIGGASKEKHGESNAGYSARASHSSNAPVPNRDLRTGKRKPDVTPKDFSEQSKQQHAKVREEASKIKPKLQGLAEGGNVNAKNERRPMPDNRYDDSKMISQNSGKKAPHDDSWTDRPDLKQSRAKDSRKVMPIKHPKMVPSDAFSVRMRDEEDHLQESASPGPYGEQPPERDNEERPNRQGPKVSDMEDEHSTHRKPYAKGGMIDDMDHPSKHDMEPQDHGIEEEEREDEAHLMSMESPSEDEGASDAHSMNEEDPDRSGHPVRDMEREHSNGRMPYAEGGEVDEDEMMLDHAASIAAAIMAKRDRKARQDSDSDIDHEMMMAEGGYINGEDSIYSDDSDQADLRRNAEEDKNLEDQSSFDALRKENYSESEGLELMDSPEDSNLHGDPREDEEENDHDKSIVGSIRRKMKSRSPISR